MNKKEIKKLLNSEKFNNSIKVFYEYLKFLEEEVLTLPGQDPNGKNLVQTAPEEIKNKNEEKRKKIEKSRVKILQMFEKVKINENNLNLGNNVYYIKLRCWLKELVDIIKNFFDDTTERVNRVANRQGFKNKVMELRGLELLISRINKL